MRETKLTPLTTRPKIHYLEGVRGYAALTVMVYHLSHELLTPLLQDNRLLMLLTSNGPLGLLCEKKHSPITPRTIAVSIFFLLSGRVICNSILKRPTLRNVCDTSIRRIFRLVVPIAWTFAYLYISQRIGMYSFRSGVLDNTANKFQLDFINSHQLSLIDIFWFTWDMVVNIQSHEFGPGWYIPP